MDKLTQWIAAHPVVTTWITLISLLGVIITVIALILQIKDKRRRMICYTVASTALIGDKISAIDGIKIFFQDEEVSTLAVSNIKLWNGGNEFLEERDFHSGHELKVVVPEGEKILAIKIAEQSDDVCGVKVKISPQKLNEALVEFACVEPRQGATINVYHSGTGGEEAKVTGKIKGGKIVNKSIEVAMQDGEMYMSLGQYRVYFDGGLFGAFRDVAELLYHTFGISIVKGKKK